LQDKEYICCIKQTNRNLIYNTTCSGSWKVW